MLKRIISIFICLTMLMSLFCMNTLAAIPSGKDIVPQVIYTDEFDESNYDYYVPFSVSDKTLRFFTSTKYGDSNFGRFMGADFTLEYDLKPDGKTPITGFNRILLNTHHAEGYGAIEVKGGARLESLETLTVIKQSVNTSEAWHNTKYMVKGIPADCRYITIKPLGNENGYPGSSFDLLDVTFDVAPGIIFTDEFKSTGHDYYENLPSSNNFGFFTTAKYGDSDFGRFLTAGFTLQYDFNPVDESWKTPITGFNKIMLNAHHDVGHGGVVVKGGSSLDNLQTLTTTVYDGTNSDTPASGQAWCNTIYEVSGIPDDCRYITITPTSAEGSRFDLLDLSLYSDFDVSMTGGSGRYALGTESVELEASVLVSSICTGVKFYADDVLIGEGNDSDGDDVYTISWNTAELAAGVYSVYAVAEYSMNGVDGSVRSDAIKVAFCDEGAEANLTDISAGTSDLRFVKSTDTTITAVFDGTPANSTLEIFDGETSVGTYAATTADDTYTYDISSAELEAGKAYTLKIGGSYAAEIKLAEDSIDVAEICCTDFSELVAGQSIEVDIKYSSATGQDEIFTPIIAIYKGEVLHSAFIGTANVDAKEKVGMATITNTLPEGFSGSECTVRVFVWESTGTLIPISGDISFPQP